MGAEKIECSDVQPREDVIYPVLVDVRHKLPAFMRGFGLLMPLVPVKGDILDTSRSKVPIRECRSAVLYPSLSANPACCMACVASRAT